MPYLVDTSILARLANTADANYSVAVRAVLVLHQQGDTLRITAQNLIEFRNLATRPAAVNGLGLSTAEAETKAAVFEAAFPLLVEAPEIFSAVESPGRCTRNHREAGARRTSGGGLPRPLGDTLAHV
jgi:hypothetical protein